MQVLRELANEFREFFMLSLFRRNPHVCTHTSTHAGTHRHSSSCTMEDSSECVSCRLACLDKNTFIIDLTPALAVKPRWF